MKKGIGLAIVVITLLSLSNIVIAKGKRVFSGESELAANNGNALTSLILDVPAGMVDINIVDSDVVTYRVVVEDKPTNWFLFAADLDSLVMTEKIIDQALFLKIDEAEVNQQWTLNVPRDLALQIKMGVGNLDVDTFSQSLLADIGVGSAWVSVNSDDYSYVNAAVAAGEIQVQGFEQGNLSKERVMVSDQLIYSGTGSHNIDIKVGVGDVNLSQRLMNES